MSKVRQSGHLSRLNRPGATSEHHTGWSGKKWPFQRVSSHAPLEASKNRHERCRSSVLFGSLSEQRLYEPAPVEYLQIFYFFSYPDVLDGDLKLV